MNTDQPTKDAVAALEEIAKCLPYPNGALSFVNARLLLAHIRKLEADNAELVKSLRRVEPIVSSPLVEDGRNHFIK